MLKIQIAMCLLAACSGFLLGRAVGDSLIIAASITGAILAFVFVDRLKWVELSGWLANLVTIGVLIVTMRGFIGGDSTAKLVAVANLLAWLLTVLLFQSKTPRLCWQIMMLSVLQIVVAGIFNLNFEDGIWFTLYFVLATLAMIQQNDFNRWTASQLSNRRRLENANQPRHIAAVPLAAQSSVAVVHSGVAAVHHSASFLFRLLVPWLVVSLVFAFMLFHSLPHTRQSQEDAKPHEFTGTGKSWKVNLDYDGLVSQSGALQFRARFFELNSDRQVIINGELYFRGMAMSKLALIDGHTSWVAPYDHVFDFSYRNLNRVPLQLQSQPDFRPVGVEMILEPTADPLLFAPMPVYRKIDEAIVGEFCHDLSAVTRRRSKSSDDMTSFMYRLITLLGSNNRLLPGWPYHSTGLQDSRERPMEIGSPEYRMLTDIDPARYPSLVRIADEIAGQNSGDRISLCKALVEHFSNRNRYGYTLDYRDVGRNRQLDAIEDFVQNHRQGHCALYASALTLMLRSQGIPARYVVGFYGSEFNKLTSSYVIHGHDAHAWVEAYLPPEDCTAEMFRTGVAGESGAWLTLDATPATERGSSNEALDLARSIWQDYVISPDHNKQSFNQTAVLQPTTGSGSALGQAFQWLIDVIKASRSLQIFLLAVALLYVAWSAWRTRTAASRSATVGPANPFRHLIGRAVALFASDLGQWISGNPPAAPIVPFYRRLEKLLKRRFGLERSPFQSQREFAALAASHITDRDIPVNAAIDIRQLLSQATDAFYQTRFGATPLDRHAVEEIENRIQMLEHALNQQAALK